MNMLTITNISENTHTYIITDMCSYKFYVMCRLHYKEYLVGLINKNNIDPAMSMNIEELRKVLARGEMNVPKQKHNESSAAYHKRIIKVDIFFRLSEFLKIQLSTNIFQY